MIDARVAKYMGVSFLLWAGLTGPLSADLIDWSEDAVNGNWTNPFNWVGEVVPADDITTDIARFNLTSYSFNPLVAGTRSIAGLQFGDGTTITAPITLSGTSSPFLHIGASGIQIAANAGEVTFASTLPLRLGASQSWTNDSSSLLTIAGTVSNTANVEPFTLTIAGSGSGGITISGVISDGGTTGTTALVVNTTGSGVTILSGNNTFTGGVTLLQGVLRAQGGANSLGAGVGTLALGGGELQLAGSSGTSFNRNTTVTGNAQITSDRLTEGAGLTHVLGTLSIGEYTLSVNAGTNVSSGTAAVTFGATTLTGNATFEIGSEAQLNLSSVDDGAGSFGIVKTGDGVLQMGGTGSFDGDVAINSGTLRVGSGTALGGADVLLGEDGGSADANLTLGVVTTISSGTIYVASGTGNRTINFTGSASNTGQVLTGAIVLANNLEINASLAGTNVTGSLSGNITGSGNIAINNTGNLLTISGNLNQFGSVTISGTGSVTLSGSIGRYVTNVINDSGGTLSISGNNSLFRGDIHVNSGTVSISGLTGSNASNTLYINSGATFSRGNSTGRVTVAGINDGPDGGGILTRGTGGGTRPFEVGGDGDYSFSGIIQDNGSSSNPFSLIKTGTGTQSLTGASTYSGGTSLGNGTLRLGVNTATGNIGSLAATAIGGHGGTFIYDGTGSTASNNNSQSLGSLTFTRGSTTIESIKGSANSSTLTFSSLAARATGATGNFIVADGSNGVDNRIVLTGVSTGFMDRGFFYNGSNYAYYDSGGFVRGINWGVDSGSTTVAGGGSLATTTYAQTTGDVTAQNSATFTGLNIVNTTSGARAFTLAAGQTVTTNGILVSGNGGGTTTISGGTSIRGGTNAELVIRTDQVGDILEISSVIVANGTNALTKDGDGTLILAGINDYTGQTFVNGGVLSISQNANLGRQSTGAQLTLNNGTLQATGTFGLYNSTAGTNNRNVLLVNTGTFEVTDSNTLTIAGVISDEWDATGSSNWRKGTLAKTGTGTLLLSGTNTYHGDTLVNAGTLTLASTGSIANSALIRIASGAIFNASAVSGGFNLGTGQRLENAGRFTGDLNVQSGAIFSPGNSPGIAEQDGNLTLETGSTFEFELIANSTSGAGTNYDLTSFLSGGLTIETGVTADLIFDLEESTVDWTDGFWASDQSWLIFSGADSLDVTGDIFSTIVVGYDSSGQDFSISGGTFSFSQSGNDIYLNYTAVPEPSTYAMLLGGLGLLAWLRRRKS